MILNRIEVSLLNNPSLIFINATSKSSSKVNDLAKSLTHRRSSKEPI